MCNVYIPVLGSKVLNSQDVDIQVFECLEQGVINYKSHGKLYVTDNFNSRTAPEQDHLDSDTIFSFSLRLAIVQLLLRE